MKGFLFTERAKDAAAELAKKLPDGRYAIITARDRKGKETVIRAADAPLSGSAPPCFDKEAYDAIASLYPERTDLLTALFTYHRWDGRAFHPAEPLDHPLLRAADYAIRHRLEITGMASFSVQGDGILFSTEIPETLWEMLGLRFIYADEAFAAADKAAGMLSAPGKGEDKLDSASYRFHSLFPSSPEQCFTHRLDMDTSGILLLAFTKEAHRNISMQFEARTIRKEYEAVLQGIIREDEGVISMPIRLDPDRRPLQVADPEQGKKAVTRWKKIAEENGNTRVRFFPETGRTHQLRVHSAYIGHPIIGDRLYGTRMPGERLHLHAAYIELNHPASGERISFSSPVPF